MSANSLQQRLRVSIVLIFVQACFSGYAILSHVVLSGEHKINPGVFILCRDVGCAIVLLTAARVQSKQWIWPDRDDLIFFVGLGVFNVYFGQYYFVMGIKYTNALTASIWQNTLVAFTCVLGVASGIEHIECGKLHGVLKIVGVICSLAGAVCNTLLSSGSSAPSALNTTLCSALQPAPGVEANVSFFMLQQPHATAAVGSTQLAALATNASVPAFVAHGCEHVTVVYTSNQQGEALIGNVFFFLQCLFGSVFFILQKAVFQKEKYSSLHVVAWGYCAGAMLMVLVVTPNALDVADWTLSTRDGLAILYVIFISSALCYALYAWANKSEGPLYVVIHGPCQIIFTALLSLAFFGKPITKGDCIGGALVTAGLFLLVKGKVMEEDEQKMRAIPHGSLQRGPT